MVQAWYMDGSDADQRLPHQSVPLQLVSLEDLRKLTGVLHWKIEIDNAQEYKRPGQLFDVIKKERGYSYEDTISVSRDKLPGYDEKIKSFYKEHLHTDEEVRFILDGSGYFDVRSCNDERWIRIEMGKGDLIVLPAGIYHRFTLDTNDYIVANRLFIGEPVWTPHDRNNTTDTMDARTHYLASMAAAAS